MLPRNRSKNIISEITKRYARKGIRSEDITQERLDIDIHSESKLPPLTRTMEVLLILP
jgi:hypothetical protein